MQTFEAIQSIHAETDTCRPYVCNYLKILGIAYVLLLVHGTQSTYKLYCS